MATTPKLSDVQIRVLKWIYEGCPDEVVWKGYANRTASRALASRGLVTVSGKGPTWSVSITDAGRDWVGTSILPAERMQADALRLLQRVSQAGGTLIVDEAQDEANYPTLINALRTMPDRPHGQMLLRLMIDYRHRISALTITPEWAELANAMSEGIPLRALPVIPRGSKINAGIRHFLDDRDWQSVSAPSLKRAAEVLLRIRAEATRRGWGTVMRGDPGVDDSALPDGVHVRLFPPNHSIDVRIREIPGHGARKMTREEAADSGLPIWIRKRGFTFPESGKLELSWGGSAMRDITSESLEQQVPRLFRSSEVASLLWAQKQTERARLKNLVEDHMDQLRSIVGAAEPAKRYWAEFEKRFLQWQRVAPMRKFLASMSELSEAMPTEERGDYAAWLASVSEQLDAIDPLVVRGPAPAMGRATREEVLAYIRGE